MWPAVESALKAFDESINKQPGSSYKGSSSKAAKALREAQTAFDKQKQNVEAGVEMAAEEENWGVGGPNSLRGVMARVMLASTSSENRLVHGTRKRDSKGRIIF